MADRYGHPHHHHQHHSDEYDGDQPPPPFPPPSFRPDFPSYDDRPPPPPRFSSYDDQPPPPPPSFASYENQPPPFRPPEYVSGGYQSSGSHYAPPQDSSHGYPHQHQEAAHHVSDEPAGGGEERHRFRPHVPAFVESHIHGHGHQSEGGSGPDLSSKPSVKVYCQADTNHMLAIRDGKVILARSDPNDPTQHWVKDERYSTKVKDQDRYPSFALVNKATGQALKHSIGATHPVQLIAYNPDVLDESILWTMGKDLGGEYRQIRMVNNTRLVFDAFNGDKKHGGVHDGTTVVLWEPGKGDNQRWHITPYCKSVSLNRVCVILVFIFLDDCVARACLCGHEKLHYQFRMILSNTC